MTNFGTEKQTKRHKNTSSVGKSNGVNAASRQYGFVYEGESSQRREDACWTRRRRNSSENGVDPYFESLMNKTNQSSSKEETSGLKASDQISYYEPVKLHWVVPFKRFESPLYIPCGLIHSEKISEDVNNKNELKIGSFL